MDFRHGEGAPSPKLEKLIADNCIQTNDNYNSPGAGIRIIIFFKTYGIQTRQSNYVRP